VKRPTNVSSSVAVRASSALDDAISSVAAPDLK
jgi:hypothetical protein